MAKTIIKSQDSKEIQRGLNNPAGMLIVDQPDVRQAVAQEIDIILQSLREKHAYKLS